MDEVPNRSNVIVKLLENDRLALTSREPAVWCYSIVQYD